MGVRRSMQDVELVDAPDLALGSSDSGWRLQEPLAGRAGPTSRAPLWVALATVLALVTAAVSINANDARHRAQRLEQLASSGTGLAPLTAPWGELWRTESTAAQVVGASGGVAVVLAESSGTQAYQGWSLETGELVWSETFLLRIGTARCRAPESASPPPDPDLLVCLLRYRPTELGGDYPGGLVQVRRASTGTDVVQRSVDIAPLAGVVWGADLVLAGTSEGSLVVRREHAQTGELIWETALETAEPVFSSSPVDLFVTAVPGTDRVAFSVGLQREAFVLDESGAVTFHRHLAPPRRAEGVRAGPSGGQLFATWQHRDEWGAAMDIVDTDGMPVLAAVGTAVPVLADDGSAPDLVVANHRTGAWIVDTTERRRLWSSSGPQDAAVVVAGLVVLAGDGGLAAVDARWGRPVWQVLDGGQWSLVGTDGELVLAMARDVTGTRFVAIDAATGRRVFASAAALGERARLEVVDGRVLAVDGRSLVLFGRA